MISYIIVHCRKTYIIFRVGGRAPVVVAEFDDHATAVAVHRDLKRSVR